MKISADIYLSEQDRFDPVENLKRMLKAAPKRIKDIKKRKTRKNETTPESPKKDDDTSGSDSDSGVT